MDSIKAKILGLSFIAVLALTPLDALAEDFKIVKQTGLSGRLAFTAAVNGKQEIYVLDFDGKKVRRTISGEHDNYYPAWSPDGSKLAFASNRDGNEEIYVADWDGQNQRRLTNNNVRDDNPAWAPDGSHIVYYSETGKRGRENSSNIFFIDPNDPIPIQVTSFSGRNSTPQLSPDGKKIAYSTNRFWPGWDICLWDLAQDRERCILKGATTYCRPDFSPSGKRLAYSYGIGNDIDAGILDLDTGKRQAITNLKGREYDLTWSPDGKYIALVSDPEDRDKYQIYLYAIKANETELLLSSAYSVRYLSWSAHTTMQLEAKRAIEYERQKELLALTPEISAIEIAEEVQPADTDMP